MLKFLNSDASTPPVGRPAQRVAFQVAERTRRRPLERAAGRADRRGVEPAIARLIVHVEVADHVRPVRTDVAIGASAAVRHVERHAALDDQVRVELPSAHERVGQRRRVAHEALALADRK